MTATSNHKVWQKIASTPIGEWLLLGFVAALLFAAFYVSGWLQFDLSGKERMEAIAALRRDLPSLAERELRQLRKEEPSRVALQPSLIYEGITATVILRGEVLEDTYGLLTSRESLKYELLARTPAGRYFLVSYRLGLDDVEACRSEPASCLSWRFSPFSTDEAMNMVFHAKQFTPSLFRSIFCVDPPAATASIPA